MYTGDVVWIVHSMTNGSPLVIEMYDLATDTLGKLELPDSIDNCDIDVNASALDSVVRPFI